MHIQHEIPLHCKWVTLGPVSKLFMGSYSIMWLWFSISISLNLAIVRLRGDICALDKKMAISRATPREFAHVAIVEQTVEHSNGTVAVLKCRAAVIHPLLLLSTPSCLSGLPPKEIAVRTGVHDWRTYRSTKQDRRVRGSIPYETDRDGAHGSNLALLVLEEPLRFDEYTSPIAIPELHGRRKGKKDCEMDFCQH